MKKTILMGLGMAVLGLPLLAMAADFSGSWVQDPKSDRVPEPMWLTRVTPNARGGRGGGPGGRGSAADGMTVKQDAGSIQINDVMGGVRKYSLDGKAATQKTETFMGQAAVTAKMEGDNFVIATSRPYGGMPGNVTLQISEVWSLSADGKVLTITTTHDSPAVKKVYKQTYNRR